MHKNNVSMIAIRKPLLVINSNVVIKNTYILLSLSMLFSAFTAVLSMSLTVPPFIYLASMLEAMLLMWLALPHTDRSAIGVLVVFAITGLIGFGLGPSLNMYIHLPGGPEIIATAVGGTGAIFFGLSVYALTTRRDFSFIGGFLLAGIVVLLCSGLANLFLAIPVLSITMSAVVVLLMSGFILYDTSNLIHGGETNYLHATIQLYLNIFNMFINLLQLLAFLSLEDW